MGDRPPGGLPAAPIPNPVDPNMPANPLTQRTFFSGTAANDFFQQLQAVLDRQHAQTLQAQESFVKQMNEPVVALTGVLSRLLTTMPLSQLPPPSNLTSPTPSNQQSPPPVPARPSSVPPMNPYCSQPPPNGPSPPVHPPVCEGTAFSYATADTATPSSGVPGIKLPDFNGDDGENVVAWLNQLERYFRLTNIILPEKKVDLASFSITGSARSFFYHCYKLNHYAELT